MDVWRSSVAAGSLGAREPRVGEVAVRVLTAAELDAMTPAEREAAFEASIIRDLADVPAEYQHVVDDLRRRVLEREAAARQAS